MLRANAPLSIPMSNRVAAPVSFFVSREDQINTIVDILRGTDSNPASGKRCIIRGNSGTGKTELCRAVASQLLRDYPDAQIYLRVDDSDSVTPSLFKILETIIHIFAPLALLPEDLDLLYGHYRSVVDGKRGLIILEDLPSGLDLHLLNLPSSCALLIATNENLEIPDIYSISLSGLSQEDSEQLLVSICPRIGQFAATLSNLCQNLPLNLCLVAGYLNRNSVVLVEDFISEVEKRFEKTTDAGKTSVEKLLDYIVEHLSGKERSFLSQLAVVGEGFHKELVLELMNLENSGDHEPVQAYLDIFTSLNFLRYDQEQGYYRMQPTIQDFALKSLGDAAKGWSQLGKMFTTSTNWYNSLANSGADEYLLSVLVFDEHKTTIRNVLEYLRNHSSVERDQIFLDFYDLICLFGGTRFAKKIELIPWLVAMMKASIRLQDKDRLAAILGQLSKIYQRLGEAEQVQQYSNLEEIIRTDQSEGTKQVLEHIRNNEPGNQWDFDTLDRITSDSTLYGLEEFSTKKTKIVLTGFMGTGKTTVGKLLADYLNYRFIDTDELIETHNKRSISDIFQELGEDAFREMERAIVREIAELDGVVISTGGRLMLDPENVNALSNNSRVLCLVATPDEILVRVEEDQEHKRPLLSVPNPKQRIVELLQERDDKYRRFPQIVTDEKKPTDIAKGLVEFINTRPKSLTVENPQNSYEYVVGAGLLPFLRQLTGIEDEIVIITDEIVNALYGPSCSSIGRIIEIPAGRQNKSLVTVQSVYDQLLDKGFDRSGTIISLGGSVVGDIAGYVAATYMRGVNFIQCPTSLIAMVDTSVGGKTSLDLPQGKNMIGVYKQPTRVIADVATLQTLPQVDFASGMAEVIKHGLIAESNLLEQVEQGHWAKNWDRSPSYIGELQKLVAQAIQVKINIVQADPFEQGQRSILNLGHTFAYAIEQVSKNAYRHGEAVGMGLVAAANLSARLGFCDISLQERIDGILESVNIPARIPSHIKPDALLQAMQHDKKKRAGQLRFILMRGIGQAFVSDEVSVREIRDTLSAVSS
jgi:shikimate kinase/3-dehydroquinate synthase